MVKIKLILAGLVLCLSTQSQAIGDVEKGALIGAGSLIILNKLFEGNSRDNDRDYSYERYREPPRRYYETPQYNYYQYPRYREREVIIIERQPYYREHYYRPYRW